MTPNKPEKAPGQNPRLQQVERRGEHTNLSYRYGTIGIRAVAAAVRYAGARKNPAYAPAAQPRLDQRFVELAF